MNPRLSFAALVGLALLASALGRPPDAAAQRARDDERDDVSMSMRESVSRPLAETQGCVEMRDFECAVRALERVRARENLYPYEEAIMWRFYAFVHFEQDDTAGAISAYENLLRIAELPSGLEQESSLTLAQLYAQQERFDDALATLERWFSIVPDPGPDQYYLKARIYYQMQRYEDGIEPLERAIALADARGREPQEDWYNLLRVMYFETGDDENLLAVLARPEDCVDAAREALDRGVERPDQANLMLGACLADLRRYDEAMDALKAAARDERSRELATDYMSYVGDEHELERRMQEAIAALEAHGEQVSAAAP